MITYTDQHDQRMGKIIKSAFWRQQRRLADDSTWWWRPRWVEWVDWFYQWAWLWHWPALTIKENMEQSRNTTTPRPSVHLSCDKGPAHVVVVKKTTDLHPAHKASIWSLSTPLGPVLDFQWHHQDRKYSITAGVLLSLTREGRLTPAQIPPQHQASPGSPYHRVDSRIVGSHMAQHAWTQGDLWLLMSQQEWQVTLE